MLKKKFIVAFWGVVLAISTSAQAQNSSSNTQNKSTFSAFVDIGAIYINSTSSENTDGKKKIKDNMKEGETSSYVLPLPLFDFRYTFANTGTQLFLGTPLDSANLGLTLGVVQPTESLGRITGSIVTSFGEKVWKNPYEENVNRSSTGVDRITVTIEVEQIAGTGFNATVSNKTMEITDDEIGELFSDLKRDGTVKSAEFSYNIGLDQTSMVTPGIMVAKGDIEGRSNSYDESGISFSYKKFNPKYILMLKAYFGTSSYDKAHPIYNKTRNEQSAGCMVFVNLNNLFDVESLYAKIITGAALTDSNIDFFDNKTILTGATIGYSF